MNDLRYKVLIGTGGIGSGKFFKLNGNHTLGREESRSGHFLAQRDYCKLHIISHYVKVLLGPNFQVITVGMVGEDELGHQIFNEMTETGFDMRFVEFHKNAPTLNSICFLYPDGTGGNLTIDDSACNYVGIEYISQLEEEFTKYRGKGIALAAAEVPLEARKELLQLATQYSFYRVANFTTGEMKAALSNGSLKMVDLLGINLDEAGVVAEMDAETSPPLDIVLETIKRLRIENPSIHLSITAGKNGSWTWDGKTMNHISAIPVHVISSAGAGDTHLAGIIVGLITGLHLFQAQELGSLAASLSVTSPHTIHPGINRTSLCQFAKDKSIALSSQVLDFIVS